MENAFASRLVVTTGSPIRSAQRSTTSPWVQGKKDLEIANRGAWNDDPLVVSAIKEKIDLLWDVP